MFIRGDKVFNWKSDDSCCVVVRLSSFVSFRFEIQGSLAC